MKKKLTSDITRYDNRIRVRFNLYTFKALLLSGLIGTCIFVPLLYVSMMLAVTLGLTAALIVFLLMITQIDGLPLYTYLIYTVCSVIKPDRQVKYYENYISEVKNDEKE